MLFSFRAVGEPHPQPRPSVTREARVYYRDPTGKMRRWKEAVMAAAREVGVRQLQVPCTVLLTFWLPRPARHLRSNGTLNPEGERNPYPIGPRADVDNLAKLVLDVIVSQGIIVDDGRVVALNVAKRWATAEEPSGCQVVAFGSRSD